VEKGLAGPNVHGGAAPRVSHPRIGGGSPPPARRPSRPPRRIATQAATPIRNMSAHSATVGPVDGLLR